MAVKKKGLGKGLDSLIPENKSVKATVKAETATEEVAPVEEVVEAPAEEEVAADSTVVEAPVEEVVAE